MQLFKLVLSAERLIAIIFVLCISMVVGNTESQVEMTQIDHIADTYLGFSWEERSPDLQKTVRFKKRLQKCDSDEVLVETKTEPYLPHQHRYSNFTDLEPDTCYSISIARYLEETDETLAFSEPLSQKTASRAPEAIPESFTASFSPEDGQVHIESQPAPDASLELEFCCLFQSIKEIVERDEVANTFGSGNLSRPYQTDWPEERYKCIKLENDVISPENIDRNCINKNKTVLLIARFKHTYSMLVTSGDKPYRPYTQNYTQYSPFSTFTPLDLSAWKSGSYDPRSDMVFDMIDIYPVADTYLGFNWQERSRDFERSTVFTKRLQKCDSDEVLVETQTEPYQPDQYRYSFFSNLEPDTCYNISIARYLEETNETLVFSEPLSQKTASRPPEVIPELLTASFSPEDGQVHIESRPAPDASQELELCCLILSHGIHAYNFSELNLKSVQMYRMFNTDGTEQMLRPYQPDWPREDFKCIKLENDILSPETFDKGCIRKNKTVVLAARFKQFYSNLVTGDSKTKGVFIDNYTQYSLFSNDKLLDLSAWKIGS